MRTHFSSSSRLYVGEVVDDGDFVALLTLVGCEDENDIEHCDGGVGWHRRVAVPSVSVGTATNYSC